MSPGTSAIAGTTGAPSISVRPGRGLTAYTVAPSTAARVFLNLAPGVVAVTDVLDVLIDAIPIEAAEVMVPANGPEPPIFAEFRLMLEHETDRISQAPFDALGEDKCEELLGLLHPVAMRLLEARAAPRALGRMDPANKLV